jgi:hypothetical protein
MCARACVYIVFCSLARSLARMRAYSLARPLDCSLAPRARSPSLLLSLLSPQYLFNHTLYTLNQANHIMRKQLILNQTKLAKLN